MLAWAALPAAIAPAAAADVQVALPPLIQIKAGGDAPLPIELSPRGSVPNRSIILIKGLPSSISLNQGRLFDSGVWGIPIANVEELRLITGGQPVGRTAFSVSLVSFTGDLLAEGRSNLAVVSQGQPLEATAAVQQADQMPPVENVAPPAAAGFRKTRAPDDRQAAATPASAQPGTPAMDYIMLCMEKGDSAMRMGDIGKARLFYTQAAEQGWADGAFALAATYDPSELANVRVMGGIQPDAPTAKRWYQKAAELGSRHAETRLYRMDRR